MQCMVLIGINMMGNIQKEKYIADVVCANLKKSLDCRQSEIGGNDQGKRYY